MPLSDRHAPEDTVIRRENLDANLQVHTLGRYYPEEYGSQIQASAKRHDIIADVPATLAGIVVDRNDHALSSWANQERLQHYEDEIFYEQLEKNKRQLLDLDADLTVHDEMMKMNSELIQAREDALAKNGKVADAYNTVFEKYQGRFDDTPALANRFNKEFLRSRNDLNVQGLKEDVTNMYYKLGNNLNITMEGIYKKISQGEIGAIDGIQQLVKDSAKWYKYMHATDVDNYLNKAFNTFVLGEAERTVNAFKLGEANAKQTMTDLQGLHNIAQNLSVNLVDENNNILKDANNEDRTATFSLDIKTQDYLEQALRDIKSSGGDGSGGGEGTLLDIKSDFKEHIGYDQLQEKGYSDKLLNTTPEEFATLCHNVMDGIINSTASDSKKKETADEILQAALEAGLVLDIAKINKDTKGNTAVVLKTAANNLRERIRTQNFTGDWVKNTFDVVVDGKTHHLDIGNLTETLQRDYGQSGLIPHLGSTQQEASLMWKRMADVLDKAADNASKNDMSNFLQKHDAQYSASADNIQGSLKSSFLIKKDNATGQKILNKEGLDKLINPNIAQMKQVSEKNGSITIVSPEIMEQYTTAIKTNNADPVDCFLITEGLAESFVKNGAGGDIYNYAKYNRRKVGAGFEDKDRNDLTDFYTVYALSKNSSANQTVKNMIQNGTYTEASSIIKNKNKGIAVSTLETVCDKLHIAKEDRSLYYSLANVLAAANVTDMKKGTIDEKNLRNQLEATLDSLYVRIPNSFMKDNGIGNRALFKEANYLKPFVNERTGGIDTNKLNTMATEAISLIRNATDTTPMLKDKLNNVAFYPDSERGCFRLVSNGTGFRTRNGNFTGMLIYSTDLKNIDPKQIGQVAALQIISTALLRAPEQNYGYDQMIKSTKVIPNAHIGIDSKDDYFERQQKIGTKEQYIKRLVTISDIVNDPKKVTKILKQTSSQHNYGSKQIVNHTLNYNIQSGLANVLNVESNK